MKNHWLLKRQALSAGLRNNTFRHGYMQTQYKIRSYVGIPFSNGILVTDLRFNLGLFNINENDLAEG